MVASAGTAQRSGASRRAPSAARTGWGVGGPLGNGGKRAGAGQHRGCRQGQDGDQRMAAAQGTPRVGDGGQLADPGVLVYVLLLRAWVVRLAVRGWWHRDGVADDTDHHLYDRLRRCQDRASRDATSRTHGGDGEIPRNRRRWVLPAALVVVGVLMMVIGSFRQGDYASAIWLQLGSVGPGPVRAAVWAQRMLERESPSESPGSSL
jgi:hypothetical protein